MKTVQTKHQPSGEGTRLCAGAGTMARLGGARGGSGCAGAGSIRTGSARRRAEQANGGTRGAKGGPTAAEGAARRAACGSMVSDAVGMSFLILREPGPIHTSRYGKCH